MMCWLRGVATGMLSFIRIKRKKKITSSSLAIPFLEHFTETLAGLIISHHRTYGRPMSVQTLRDYGVDANE